MRHEQFTTTFNKNISSLDYNKQLSLAVEICKKLYFDYVAFAEKYHWGNPDILLDAIKLLAQSSNEIIDKTLIEQIQENIGENTPHMDHFGSDVTASCALNACSAIYHAFLFLSDKEARHVYDVGICFTDSIDSKIQEHGDLTEAEIDAHPLMIEATNYLIGQSNKV